MWKTASTILRSIRQKEERGNRQCLHHHLTSGHAAVEPFDLWWDETTDECDHQQTHQAADFHHQQCVHLCYGGWKDHAKRRDCTRAADVDHSLWSRCLCLFPKSDPEIAHFHQQELALTNHYNSHSVQYWDSSGETIVRLTIARRGKAKSIHMSQLRFWCINSPPPLPPLVM